jgi:hypothetical protein
MIGTSLKVSGAFESIRASELLPEREVARDQRLFLGSRPTFELPFPGDRGGECAQRL